MSDDPVHPVLGRTPAVQLFRLLVGLGLRTRARMDQRLAAVGLTTQQAVVLTIVGSAEGPLTLGDLGRRLGSSHQNARQLVDALVRKGLLAEEPDPRDRRARRLRTTAGVAALFDGREAEDEAEVRRWLGALGEDEMRVAVALLSRVARDDLASAG